MPSIRWCDILCLHCRQLNGFPAPAGGGETEKKLPAEERKILKLTAVFHNLPKNAELAMKKLPNHVKSVYQIPPKIKGLTDHQEKFLAERMEPLTTRGGGIPPPAFGWPPPLSQGGWPRRAGGIPATRAGRARNREDFRCQPLRQKVFRCGKCESSSG